MMVVAVEFFFSWRVMADAVELQSPPHLPPQPGSIHEMVRKRMVRAADATTSAVEPGMPLI